MLFNSLTFFLFLVVVVTTLFVLPRRLQWFWLLGASLFFYASWNVEYLSLILLTAVTSYGAGILVSGERPQSFRKLVLYSTLLLNFAVLFVFKYFNFFAESVNELAKSSMLEMKIDYLDFLLPVGISFYTFQAASYVIDVYRNDTKPEKHLGRFLLYVSFFPQLVAGPIERSSKLLPQLRNKFTFDYNNFREGAVLILWGLVKKIVVADRLAQYVDSVYSSTATASSAQLLVAMFFFSFQIYCDFSGYTDIAVGCARLIGVDLTQNFRRPYFATSIQDFWRRWHITLSTWFRDYMYIPLGGNRVSAMRHMINLVSVFLVCGLWHGASWTFVIWGGIHGALLIVNHFMRLHCADGIFSKIPGQLKVLFTFVVVTFAWVFFRSPSLETAFAVISGVFATPIDFSTVLHKTGFEHYEFVLSLLGIAFLVGFEKIIGDEGIRSFMKGQHLVCRWCLYYLMLFSCVVFGIFGVTEFIYFQF